MATFNITLTELRVESWNPDNEAENAVLIENAQGIYSVSMFGTDIGYYLQVGCGDRIKSLRKGQPVTATGRDGEGKLITTVVLETTGAAEHAQFKGPYRSAIEAVKSEADSGNFLTELETNNGAQFWGYISTAQNTQHHLTEWKIIVSQGSWRGEITSADPKKVLKTPGLSGIFDVEVEAGGPNMSRKRLAPQQGSRTQIGANANCSSMVGIVSNGDGTDAYYWTTWDAFCKESG